MPKVYTGFHAVEERIRREAEKASSASLQIFYSKPGPRIKKILTLAQSIGISAEETDGKKLDAMVASLPEQSRDHRGIVLTVSGEEAASSNEVDFENWLKDCPEKATVIVLDGVTDPHNVGAIIRSADQFGASLVVMGEHRSVGKVTENEVIARSSAGASAWVPLAVVTNLSRTVQALKENGFWIYGADADGETLSKTQFPQKTCIIMGSEGNGMTRILSSLCDSIVSIPTCGKIDSLNVSVAAGVLLYERYRQEILAK